MAESSAPAKPSRTLAIAALIVGLVVGLGAGFALVPRPPPVTNVISIPGMTVNLAILAGPGPDSVFHVGGLLNPTIEIEPGANVTVYLENVGSVPHTWGLVVGAPPFEGLSSTAHVTAPPGQSATVSFLASEGDYWYVCQVPGHIAGGMYGVLLVR